MKVRARRLFAFGKGIVALDATDDSGDALGAGGPGARRARQEDDLLAGLLDAPGLAARTSGVVLPAAAWADGGRPRQVRDAGMLAGARADVGSESILADGQAQVSSGLDGLAARLGRLREQGAGFAVWHMTAIAALEQDALHALTVNSQSSARFAYVCQDMALVPVIRLWMRPIGALEPLSREAILAAALISVGGHLEDLGVDLAGVVLGMEPELGKDADPLSAGPLAALPRTLGGVLLAARPHRPATDALAKVRSVHPPWPVTSCLDVKPGVDRAARVRAASIEPVEAVGPAASGGPAPVRAAPVGLALAAVPVTRR